MRRKVLISIIIFLSTVLMIVFLPSIVGNIKKLSAEKINFLKQEAHDGNISAAYELAEYYLYKDEKQAQVWVEIVHKLQTEKETRIKGTGEANKK